MNYEQAVELAEAVNKHGVPNKLLLLEKAGHSFTFDRWKGAPLETDLLPPIVSFLQDAAPVAGK